MARPRVLVLLPPPLHDELLVPQVRQVLDSFADWAVLDRPLAAEEVGEVLAGCDGAMTGWDCPPLPADLRLRAPGLRIVAHAGGTIRGIMPPALIQQGLTVTNAATATAPYVAEVALGLTIASLRRLPESHLAIRAGRWEKLEFRGVARSLVGATVGLVGLGAIARSFAEMLASFHCRLLACDPYCQAPPPGIELTGLDRLLAESLVVSLHAPGTAETRHMIGGRELALMHDGAVLVNTARGSLVDHDALLAEVQAGRLRAALDVTEPEPLPAGHPLRQEPGAIILPHIAGRVHDQTWQVALTAAENLRAFFAGEQPPGLVTVEMLGRMG